MDETSQAFPELDPYLGVDEASLGADDALVNNLEVLMPGDGAPEPVTMPSRGRGGNKRPPVPTRVDIIESRPPASYPKADNAPKREASRGLDNTMRKHPIANPAVLQAIKSKMDPPVRVRAVPQQGAGWTQEEIENAALVVGGIALLGLSAYFLIKHLSAAPAVVAEVVTNVPTP